MGGQDSKEFKKFVALGSQVFNIIRENGNMLITLFLLMLGTGIPELTSSDDILWIRNHLRNDLNPKEAATHFEELVEQSLGDWRAQFNDLAHIWAHSDKLKNIAQKFH
jgi:hypothetical protein